MIWTFMPTSNRPSLLFEIALTPTHIPLTYVHNSSQSCLKGHVYDVIAYEPVDIAPVLRYDGTWKASGGQGTSDG